MIEKWKEVPGWPDYAVSSFGRVMRIAKPKRGRAKVGDILSPRIPGGGQYPAVNLTEDGVSTHWYLHRLVAYVFLGPCPEGEEVNHIDGDKTNPRLENVEYVTRSENMLHAFERGLNSNRGEKNPRTRLSEDDVRTIRAEFTGAYGECAALARRFGVSHAAVQDIIHGRRWSHLQAA